MNFKLVLCLLAAACALAVAKKDKVQEDKLDAFADAVLFTAPSLFKKRASDEAQALSLALESARQIEQGYSPYYYPPQSEYYPTYYNPDNAYTYEAVDETDDEEQAAAVVYSAPSVPVPVPAKPKPPVPGHSHSPHHPGFTYPHYPTHPFPPQHYPSQHYPSQHYPSHHYPPHPYPPHPYPPHHYPPHYPYPYPHPHPHPNPHPHPPETASKPQKETPQKTCKKIFPFADLCY